MVSRNKSNKMWMDGHHFKSRKILWNNIKSKLKRVIYSQMEGSFFFFFFNYLFLAALGPGCCTQVFSSCGERGLLFVAVHGFLIAVASLVVEHGL